MPTAKAIAIGAAGPWGFEAARGAGRGQARETVAAVHVGDGGGGGALGALRVDRAHDVRARLSAVRR